MKPIEWNTNKMDLGIKVIDEQHKHLLNIINQLSTTITKESVQKDILHIIDKFIDYANFHFSTEEELFEKVTYIESIKHKEEHREFINKFKEIKLQIKNQNLYKNVLIQDIARDIFIYVTNWVLNHILISDKKYVELLKENKKKFILKDITILYIEDEMEVNKYFTKILKLKVKTIHSYSSGQEALDFFKEKKANIDLIISDIEIPSLNGIELLKEVRKIDKEIPYIILSAFIKSDYLLDSIKYNVSEYIPKPVKIDKLFYKIDELFYRKMNKLKLKHQRNEIETYLDTLGNVALVSKMDLNGMFTYVNDLYCEAYKYKREEFIGAHYSLILHKDISQTLINKIKETVKEGKKWKGQIKNKEKDGNSLYVSMTILPLFENDDNEISGFMAIKFLITDMVEEKREFKKNVISNISGFKKEQYNFLKKISFLEENLAKSNDEIMIYKNQNNKIESKYKRTLMQIEFFEKSIKERDKQYNKILEMHKTSFQQLNDTCKNLSKENEKNRNEIFKLKEEQILRAKEIVKLNDKLNNQAKIVSDLRNTIKNI